MMVVNLTLIGITGIEDPLRMVVNLTLIGITGIEDPLRDGVREAVSDCKIAGIRMTVCTGDNVLTSTRPVYRSTMWHLHPPRPPHSLRPPCPPHPSRPSCPLCQNGEGAAQSKGLTG